MGYLVLNDFVIWCSVEPQHSRGDSQSRMCVFFFFDKRNPCRCWSCAALPEPCEGWGFPWGALTECIPSAPVTTRHWAYLQDRFWMVLTVEMKQLLTFHLCIYYVKVRIAEERTLVLLFLIQNLIKELSLCIKLLRPLFIHSDINL